MMIIILKFFLMQLGGCQAVTDERQLLFRACILWQVTLVTGSYQSSRRVLQ